MQGYTNSAEDKLLLSRAYDAIELSERRGIPRFVGFLNEHEAGLLRDNISPRRDTGFWGGYPDAERVMFGAGAAEEDYPITALEFTHRSEFTLTHRDYLGALMAAGIRRDTVGDILTGEGRAVIFFTDDIVPYILSNIDRIGRVGVKVAVDDPLDLPARDMGEELVLTLSSLRLDVFVAAACNLSREKAAQLIRSDMVMVDHVINNGVSSNLSEGSVVTVRRYGRFILTAVLGSTRKGKLRAAVRYYGKNK